MPGHLPGEGRRSPDWPDALAWVLRPLMPATGGQSVDFSQSARRVAAPIGFGPVGAWLRG